MSPPPEPADAAPLPADVATLKALLLAERASAARLAGQNEQLRAIVKELQRALFGRRSEKTADPDQLQLALEDLEQALAEGEAAAEKSDATLQASRRQPRRVNRGALPRHLPRDEVVIEPASTVCPCCGGALHRIGEDVAERLDVIPAQFRVLVTRRPKYGCRACESAVVQAPAPARLIEGGLPTEAMIAHVLVAKYADHLPLYRQSQIYARQGIELDRSTLADWVGQAAAELRPLHERLFEHLKGSPKLFMDETRAPVLDPGRKRTKTGYLWAVARDDRPWAGPDPPAVVYLYAPGRGAEHAIGPLAGFSGVLQVDAYAAYNALADPARADGPVTLAYCWSHVRRRFDETPRAATPRSLRRPSCASPHSLGSSARSVAMRPSSAAPCAWPKPGRSSMICALGSRRSSPRSQAAPASPGRSGTPSSTGPGSPSFSTTAGSRSSPTWSSAPSARSPSTARTLCSPAPTRAASTGASSPR